VNLSGWKLSDAISYTFATNTVLAPDSYLVVAKNAAHLLTNYPNLTAINTLGDFGGKLSGAGERLALTMPDTIVVTNSSGVVETNLIHITVDEVTYQTGGRWGQWSDGGGSSLELIDPRGNHRLAPNWADSDETSKSQWTVIEHTGVLDNGTGTADELNVSWTKWKSPIPTALTISATHHSKRISADGWLKELKTSRVGKATKVTTARIRFTSEPWHVVMTK